MIISMLSNMKFNTKKILRKKAIENVKENIIYKQKKLTDYSKDELREFIFYEEKRLIKKFGLKSIFLATGAILGIAYL